MSYVVCVPVLSFCCKVWTADPTSIIPCNIIAKGFNKCLEHHDMLASSQWDYYY